MVNQYSFSAARLRPDGRERDPCLAVDAGSPVISVAVAVGGEIRGRRSAVAPHASGDLLAMIDATIAEAGLRPVDLALLVGVRGPGSFTGLRVGLATLKGLQMALRIPAATWDTFEVLASLAPPDELPTLACVDALRGNWLVERFHADPSCPRERAHMLTTEQLAATEPAQLIGFGISALSSPGRPLTGCTLIEPGPLAPAALTLLDFRHPDRSRDCLSRPLYLQAPAINPGSAQRPLPAR